MFSRVFRRTSISNFARRKFGGSDHGHHRPGEFNPHPDAFYTQVSKGILVIMYLWILYRFKEDRGQLFGYYKPWEHEHHHEHIEYELGGVAGDSMPTLKDHDDDEHGDEHEDDEHEEHSHEEEEED